MYTGGAVNIDITPETAQSATAGTPDKYMDIVVASSDVTDVAAEEQHGGFGSFNEDDLQDDR